MKIFHLSDLHIGKQLHGYNLREEQEDILCKICECVKKERPDVVVLAGDIYDKSIPSGEAYEIFDSFLNNIADISPNIPVLIIAGNHDSAARLKYAKDFLRREQIYVSVMPPQREEEHLEKITLEDEYGDVNFYLLPFTKPGYLRGLFGDEVRTYDDAVKKIIERENIDYSKRNVLISHQFFVSGDDEPQKCDSELAYRAIGGIDSVSVSCVKDFDYVALGHIHGRQKIGEEYIRYSGTPLKYSVSEERHNKSITVATLKEKGEKCEIDFIPLEPLRDVKKIQGTLDEIIDEASNVCDDYVSIVLTDKDSLFRPKDKLEEYYTHILEVRRENKVLRQVTEEINTDRSHMTPLDEFKEFYQFINDQPLSDEEEKELINVLEELQ